VFANTGVDVDSDELNIDLSKAVRSVLEKYGAVSFENGQGWGEDRHLMVVPNTTHRYWLHEAVEGRVRSHIVLLDEAYTT
jgi:hypothetical protein